MGMVSCAFFNVVTTLADPAPAVFNGLPGAETVLAVGVARISFLGKPLALFVIFIQAAFLGLW